MKYFGGCDVGSTYTKAVIVDENGKMVAGTISCFYSVITRPHQADPSRPPQTSSADHPHPLYWHFLQTHS